jgi:O-antigen/teichoic acid export membrane protein
MQMRLSVATQIVLACVSFAQNFALIRFAPPADYAVFVLISAIGLTAYTAQGGLILSQMIMVIPGSRSAREKRLYGGTFFLATILLMLIALPMTIVVALFFSHGEPFALIGAGLFVCAQLFREFQRSLYFARFEGGRAFAADLAVASTISAMSIALWFVMTPVQAVLLGGGIGALAPTFFLERNFDLPSSRRDLLRSIALYRRHLNDVRWSALGALISEFQSRAYVYVCAIALSPQQLALTQAARMPFGPVTTIFNGFSRGLRPHYAQLIGSGDKSGAAKLMIRHVSMILAACFALGAVMFVLWRPISFILFPRGYAGIGFVTACWLAVITIFFVRSTVSFFFQAQLMFRATAIGSAAGAVSCTALLAYVFFAASPVVAVGTVLVAECTNLLFLLSILVRERMVSINNSARPVVAAPQQQFEYQRDNVE